ncbi:MAG: hypothetical protein LBV79_10650, partial [Candidatus Adiutrix sp.]|nr:hypothetical protein [Candidatus Adiutrix sp.]
MRDNGGLNCGNDFVESVEISATHVNQLFCMLLATLLCTLLLGNLLFRDWDILRATVRVAAVCVGFTGIFYCVSKLLNSLAWGLVCLYGMILVVVYCRSPFANALFYLVAGAACVYALKFLRIQKTAYWSALAAGIIGAVTTLGARGAYISFDLLKSVMERGAHQDILYHASIASMIKNYGITSSGLHGLVDTPYHVLSHQLMAAISSLSGVGVLETYG